MIITIILICALLATIIWNYAIQDPTNDLQIPESTNKTYNQSIAIAPNDVISQIEDAAGKPILLYIYTTWCGVCKHQFPIINEMARKFQNTELKVISVAIDRNIDANVLNNYLQSYQNIYFKPEYLLYNDGLENLLKSKNIRYNKIIPLTVLIDRNGKITTRFTGAKSENYLNRKIIKILAQ
ncbi:MAG: thiol-disulfide isomerase/thioredoxin [Rickettsiales bacterium]|jgi:thiol-disulfide isomerase/thioredoxin